ncbi:MAG: TOMM precursor leader peptide-binding protein [Pseudomonadota bacterium]
MSFSMPRLPRFRRSLVVQAVPPQALFLLDEHRHYIFEGQAFIKLAPLLDGHHDMEAIMAAIGTDLAPQEVFTSLMRLLRRGCLVDADAGDEGEHAAFWEYFRVNGHQATTTLDAAELKVMNLTDVDDDEVVASLAGAGISVSKDADTALVLVDDYLDPRLAKWNREANARQSTWLICKPVGMVLWVGPMVVPGETGCWACLEQRLDANRQAQRYIRNKNGENTEFAFAKARLGAATRAGLDLTATEIARSLVLPDQSSLKGQLVTLDIHSLQIEEHVLVKRPQCSVCGAEPASPCAEAQPLVLQTAPKVNDGDNRTATTEQTFESYKHHISPITGIVSSLQTRESSEFGATHNFVAGHYFPMLGDDMNLLRVNAIARSGGKGTTELQAKTSALCESIERYSGVYWGDEALVRGSYAELSDSAVHINEIALFSDAQYEGREEFNANGAGDHHYVPERLDEEADIGWTPVWSLTHERTAYVPSAYCYYGYRDPGHFFCKCDSNGSAAGNTLEEAIVQGFLELTERDSVALWWYNRCQRPRVDVDSFDLPYWREMVVYYQRTLSRDLHVLDITADLGIPAFAVVSRRLDRAVEDILLGFSAHLDPMSAMLRALGEANQYLPALRLSAADGSTIYQLNPGETIDWWKSATYANQPYLLPDANLPTRTLSDFQNLASDDVQQDVETCVKLAGKQGLDVLVLDQTRPDVGLPVAKVIVPGMRHFWRRLAPGRLYDVPVTLGWQATANAETELNPISCFV